MKRIFTLILAVAALNSFAQDHAGKGDITGENGGVRSNVSNLKRDMGEVEAMRRGKTEFEAQMNALNFEGMKSSKNALLKLMNKEIVQVRTRLGMDRQEMIESVEEADERKLPKKPLVNADDLSDAVDDSTDVREQKQLMFEMNRIFFEIRNIELTSKPQRHYEGSILKKADEFITLMQNDIFETKKEVQKERDEINEDRKEDLDDKKKRNR